MQYFANQFINEQSSERFEPLLDQFSASRSNPDFWKTSDNLHQLSFTNDPISYGLFDYNRLQNR